MSAAAPEIDVTAVASIVPVVLPSRLLRAEAVALVSETVNAKALFVSAIVERFAIVSAVTVAVMTPDVFKSIAFASATEMLESVTETDSLPRLEKPVEA